MAVPGFTPKDESQRRNRNKPLVDWVDIENVPFDGRPATLPRIKGVTWHPQVAAWWKVVSRMPHCVLWEESDWLFAIDLALLKNQWWQDYVNGDLQAAKTVEIRRREDQLGTTAEARRKLRIRYVDVDAAETVDSVTATEVSSLDDRRRRLASA